MLAVGTPDPAARLAQPRLAPPGGRGQAALLLRPRDAEPGGGPRGRAAAGGLPGRGLADRVHVLGGRGAEEEDEDLPALSDSGDEAAWEDEDGDEAGLPHDKQQTPCLFCDRFVSPPQRRALRSRPSGCPRSPGPALGGRSPGHRGRGRALTPGDATSLPRASVSPRVK